MISLSPAARLLHTTAFAQPQPAQAWRLFLAKEARYCPALLAQFVTQQQVPAARLLALLPVDFFSFFATAIATASLRDAALPAPAVALVRSLLREPSSPRLLAVLQWFAHCFVKQVLFRAADRLAAQAESPYVLPSLLVELMYWLAVAADCPPFCPRMLFALFARLPAALDEDAFALLPADDGQSALRCVQAWKESGRFPRAVDAAALGESLEQALQSHGAEADMACDELFLQWSLCGGVSAEEAVRGVVRYAVAVQGRALRAEGSVLALALENTVELVVPVVARSFLGDAAATEAFFHSLMTLSEVTEPIASTAEGDMSDAAEKEGDMSGTTEKAAWLVAQRVREAFVLRALEEKSEFFAAHVQEVVAQCSGAARAG